MNDTVRPEKAKLTEYVSLESCSQGYCIEITSIREIRRWSSVTALPNSDSAVLGVMNLRGAVIPILDLSAQLGVATTEIGERSVVVVITLGQRVIGLLVDVVSEILSIDADAIQPNPAKGREEGNDQIIGLVSVGDQMLKVLDVETLFSETAEEAA